MLYVRHTSIKKKKKKEEGKKKKYFTLVALP